MNPRPSTSDQTLFFGRLADVCLAHASLLAVRLAPRRVAPPNLDDLPGQTRLLNTLVSEQAALIHATAPFVCAYILDAPWFERLGPIAAALIQTIRRTVPAELPLIWDGQRGETGPAAAAYAQYCFDALGLDAVTLNPYAGPEVVTPYLVYPAHGHFVLCATEHAPGAGLQQLEISDWRMLDREPNQPLYVHVSRAVQHWSPWAGVMIAGGDAHIIGSVRAVAPERWLLLTQLDPQARSACLRSGLDVHGFGLVVDDGGSVAAASNRQSAADALRSEINEVRRWAGARNASV